jgi:predicted  nucleic acid-binding Zn-ribbon protein
VKADPEAQRVLLEVQSIDTALDRNKHRDATLPERAAVAELQRTVDADGDRAVRARTVVSDLSRLLTKAEVDVASVRARADRDRALLESGSVSSSRQLSDLEHEVASLAKRQSELEDAELDVMEQLEAAERELSAIERAIEQGTAAKAEAEGARDAALEALAAERGDLLADRADHVARVPADLLALYTRIRSDGIGVAAGLVRYGRCESCQMELSRVDLDAIRSAPADEVVRCPECRAIMIRTEESGL